MYGHEYGANTETNTEANTDTAAQYSYTSLRPNKKDKNSFKVI